MQIEAISEQLFNLCMSEERSPLEQILNHGTFPSGWSAEYLGLVAQARPFFLSKKMLPKKLMLCLHWASIYPWIRFIAWNGENESTRRELGAVSETSELLLMSSIHQELARLGAGIAAIGPLRGHQPTIQKFINDEAARSTKS